MHRSESTSQMSDKGSKGTCLKMLLLCSSISLVTTSVFAETSDKLSFNNLKEKVTDLFKSKPKDGYKTIQMQNFQTVKLDPIIVQGLPQVSYGAVAVDNNTGPVESRLNEIGLINAVQIAVKRNPSIGEAISTMAAQNANIDVARSQYFPQITGGISTGGNLSSSEQRGRQMYTISATQMVYDFGKVKSNVSSQEARLQLQQANVLVSIDTIATQVATTVVNIERYKKLVEIAEQQVKGLQRIQNIAELRAQAGISSQADPVQARSYVESAQAALIAQRSLLRQNQQRLTVLLGFDAYDKSWSIPEDLVQVSDLYKEPDFNIIPNMLVAQAQVEVAKADKKQTDLSRYPTLSLVGSVSQAANGVNNNNNKEDGFYSSVSLEANTKLYQGGAVTAQIRSAGFAEEAAKAKVNSVYLDVMDGVKTTRENIENKQEQIKVLRAREITAVKTRELYQEQYKLGTRSVLDLLNAEQAIHSSINELESARYDIYSSLVQYISTTGRSRNAYDLNNISIQGFEVQP